MEIPKQYTELVGTKQTLSGGLFSHKRSEPEVEYNVLDIRHGHDAIAVMNEGVVRREHPTFQLLVRSNSMKKSRWTRSFPIREIEIARGEGEVPACMRP